MSNTSVDLIQSIAILIIGLAVIRLWWNT